MLHLSVAQISKLDRSTIGEDVLAFLQERGVPVEMSLDARICAVAEAAAESPRGESAAAADTLA